MSLGCNHCTSLQESATPVAALDFVVVVSANTASVVQVAAAVGVRDVLGGFGVAL